ncbi:MAG TPA: porin family protein [Flavisolibacter sp.]|jgi:hypothetical protein
MKKISVLALALVAVTAVFAQDPKFGLKAGLNVSKLAGAGYDWRAGFHGGVISHIHVTPAFSLQPEVMYSSQGAKYDFVNNQQVTRKLNYVNIPVLLQYNFNNGFRLQGGPQIGFLIGAKDKLADVDINTVDTDDFNSIDFSVPVGISYLSYAGLGVDARYNIGVTNVIEGSTTNIRNSVFQFGLFYLFDHHHKARSK